MFAEPKEKKKRGRSELSPREEIRKKIRDYSYSLDKGASLLLEHEALQQQIFVAESDQQKRISDFAHERIYVLQEPINHLYIQQIELLREHGFVVADCYEFITDLNNYRRTILSDPLQANDLEKINKHLECAFTQILVAGREMRALVKLYQERDSHFRKDINEKLGHEPKLLNWVNCFMHPEEGQDSLRGAVNSLPADERSEQKKRYCKEYYKDKVEDHITTIKDDLESHIENIEFFEEEYQSEKHRSYRAKLEMLSFHCTSTINDIQRSRHKFQGFLETTKACIAFINDQRETVEMEQTERLLEQTIASFSEELQNVEQIILRLVPQYATEAQTLPQHLKDFMAPWLVENNPLRLKMSIEALNNYNFNQELSQPVVNAEIVESEKVQGQQTRLL
jgi:hypothetical protein